MAANEKDNAKLAKEGYDLFSKGDMNALAQHFADNATLTSMPTGETAKGRNEVIGFISNFKTAFPDMTLSVKRQVACGTDVVTEFVATGTHKGVFKTPNGDIPPTGRKVQESLCEILQVKDGKFTESHLYFDVASLLTQIGVLNLSEAQNSL
jgi:steroid delta-isomerase-like uncharacterized protein